MFKIGKFKPFHSILPFLTYLWADLATANTTQSLPSLGDAAIKALEPVSVFTATLYNICYILGTLFLLGSIIRFKEYRENPSQTPISRPLTVLLFGLVLFAVPFIAKLSTSSHLLKV